MKTELQQKITELETKLNEMRSQFAAMPDEVKKCVPKIGNMYWFVRGTGSIDYAKNCADDYDRARIARGNCYPTEQAAIDAREQQDFIREWLNAGDVPNDQAGFIVTFYNGQRYVGFVDDAYFGPKFSTADKARKAVESHGGPDVVRERLAKGWV
jgi:hypothetical protein